MLRTRLVHIILTVLSASYATMALRLAQVSQVMPLLSLVERNLDAMPSLALRGETGSSTAAGATTTNAGASPSSSSAAPPPNSPPSTSNSKNTPTSAPQPTQPLSQPPSSAPAPAPTPTPTTNAPEAPATPEPTTAPTAAPPPIEYTTTKTKTNLQTSISITSTITTIITTTNSAGQAATSTQVTVSTGVDLVPGNSPEDGGMSAATRNTIIGVVVGVGGAIMLGGLGFVAWRMRSRKKRSEEQDAFISYDAAEKSQPISQDGSSPVPYQAAPYPTAPSAYRAPPSVNQAANF